MNERKLKALRILIVLLVLLLLRFAVGYFAGEGAISVSGIRSWIKGFGPLAPLVFILMYGALVTFGFPAVLCSTVGGLVFGKFYGTAANLFGATAGASGAFWIARLLVRDYVEEKLSGAKWYSAFSKGIDKNGFYYMLFVRLMPVFPFNGTNFASGITNIRYRSFLAATALGMLPYDFALTNTVVEVGESVANGFKPSGGLIAALILLAFVSLIPVQIKKYFDKRGNAAVPSGQ